MDVNTWVQRTAEARTMNRTFITMDVPLGVDVSSFTIKVSENRYADDITVQRARQLEGPPLWKVCYRGSVLNKHGTWEYEPMPSSRTDEFLGRCRFASAELAIAAAIVAKDML
ncbi:hypothetical protein ACSFBI_03650 [Variovorax sp. RB3P1]|uniref:hypothetical protein n=1 Tax=Variovorax sp. RB3P1 TaxID=3443732 RepID=UPI003F462594